LARWPDLEKYGDQLSGHVIHREGQTPCVVARTNNAAEHRFSVIKRGVRRRVGIKWPESSSNAVTSRGMLPDEFTKITGILL
jgi:hypothetical protein